jgi:hypothetical protein
MPRSPTGDKPENYDLYGTTDLENPALLLKGWQDLFEIWRKAGNIITTKYTIKYGAGISYHGDYYYRDKRLPDVMVIDGKPFAYDLAWFVHELTELSMARWVGGLKDRILIASAEQGKPQHISSMATVCYMVAHQQAETIENTIVRQSGVDLNKYNDQCQQWVDWLQDQPLEISPAGLSLYPYRDAGDWDVLAEIVSTGGPESQALLPTGVEGGIGDAPWNGD